MQFIHHQSIIISQQANDQTLHARRQLSTLIYLGAPPQQTKNIFDSTGDSIGAFTQRCRWPSAGAPASREPSAVHHRSNSCVKLNGTDEAEDASQKALDHGLESSPWCPCAPASSTSQTCCRRTWRPACCTPSSSPSRSCTPASRPWRHHKTKARLTSPCLCRIFMIFCKTSTRLQAEVQLATEGTRVHFTCFQGRFPALS